LQIIFKDNIMKSKLLIVSLSILPLNYACKENEVLQKNSFKNQVNVYQQDNQANLILALARKAIISYTPKFEAIENNKNPLFTQIRAFANYQYHRDKYEERISNFEVLYEEVKEELSELSQLFTKVEEINFEFDLEDAEFELNELGKKIDQLNVYLQEYTISIEG
jgi:hypothetical protein